MKPGDLILCIRSYRTTSFTKGRIYRVKSTYIASSGNGNRLRVLTELDDNGSITNGWDAKEFIVVSGINIKALARLIT